jgi:hypothetical protein
MKNSFFNKLTLAALTICVIFIGCKTIKLSDISVGTPMVTKLPALDLPFDKSAITYPPQYGYAGTSLQDDARSMFTKLIQENITDPIGEKYGYVSYNLVVGENKIGDIGLYVLSMLCFTIPNLFGMPFFVAKSSVEITVTISNSNKEVIGIYKGTGESKKYVAYYYGYGLSDGLRAANIQSLKLAYAEIEAQIEKDSADLILKLKEKGPIGK